MFSRKYGYATSGMAQPDRYRRTALWSRNPIR